jgi:hypothetical protein
VRVAHGLALDNPQVRADMIEAIEFPELARKYNVYGVPKVVINDAVEFEGALPEGPYLDKVLEALRQP